MIEVFNKITPVDILAFGIHPDDVELSCSGTILSQIEKGYKVGVCDLTKGELGSRGDAEGRLEESVAASKILGIDWRINLEMDDGFSSIDKEHILHISEIIRLSRPKIILANAIEDRHPDHPRGAKLVREAFFFSGLKKINSIKGEAHRAKALYHYIQDYQLEPDFCVDISPFFEKKMQSIKAFKTQFFQGEKEEGEQTPISSRNFMQFMESKMRVFGRSIGVEYAEGFNVRRPIGVKDITEIF